MSTEKKILKEEILRKYGSIEKFSEASGIPRGSVYNWFKRGIDTMTVSTLYTLCKALDCSPGDFIDLYTPQALHMELCSDEERMLLQKFRQDEAVANAIRLLIR